MDVTEGAVSFKFRGLYYGFYNIGNFNTLGKQIASDLKNMTFENHELIKKLVNKLSGPLEFHERPSKNFNFTGMIEVLTNPTKFYQFGTEISETDGYSYAPFQLEYVYIIDLDIKQLITKKYIFNEKDEYNFKSVKSEEIKTFNFEDIHVFWL